MNINYIFIYFFFDLSDKVLEITDGIDDLGGINYWIPLCYFCVIILVRIALIKGFKSLGKISFFTALFPYAVITVLVIRFSMLEGAKEGVEFYIGKFKAEIFESDLVWRDAVS